MKQTNATNKRNKLLRKYLIPQSLVHAKSDTRVVLLMVHAFNPGTRGGRGRWVSEFKASLVYKRTGSKATEETLSQKNKRGLEEQYPSLVDKGFAQDSSILLWS